MVPVAVVAMRLQLRPCRIRFIRESSDDIAAIQVLNLRNDRVVAVPDDLALNAQVEDFYHLLADLAAAKGSRGIVDALFVDVPLGGVGFASVYGQTGSIGHCLLLIAGENLQNVFTLALWNGVGFFHFWFLLYAFMAFITCQISMPP